MESSLPNLRSKALVQNNLRAELPLVDHARGVWLYDVDGKDYLDGCSGAVTVNLGHAHPRILEVIREQSEQVAFVHRGAFASSGMYSLADRLSVATGFEGVWFVNSGSEAVEASIQFALQYHAEKGKPRNRFLSHSRSYHGNTLGALSLSGHARRGVLGDLALDLNLLPDPYNGAEVEQLLRDVRTIVEPQKDQIAGIVFEPLSGATLGCNPLPDGYLEGLRDLTDEFGILLIADEVMTGLGRTGSMLACDHWGVVPDIVALGKGIGAGYTPIAATLLSEKVMQTLSVGSGIIRGGHTYGGNPLSVAVADAVLEVTLDEGLVEASAVQGESLRSQLEQLADRHPVVADVRGLGLMQGIDLQEPEAATLRAGGVGLGERLRRAALHHGLIIYPTTGGFNDACIIAPPLNITSDEIVELIRRLEAALIEVESTG